MRSLPLLIAGVLACAPGTTTLPSPEVAAAAPSPPLAIHWFRTAAEQQAAFVQTYRLAGARLEALARERPAGTWAVILDADETVLDNSTYQKERAERGLPFTSESSSRVLPLCQIPRGMVL